MGNASTLIRGNLPGESSLQGTVRYQDRQTRSKSVAGHTIGPTVWRRVTRRIAQSLPLGDARAAGRLSLGTDAPGALVRAVTASHEKEFARQPNFHPRESWEASDGNKNLWSSPEWGNFR